MDEERGDMNLLEQNLQFQSEKIKELEKETDQKFGKIDEKIERIEERQHRQENDINSVKSDVTFIKNAVQQLSNDLKKKNEDELKQKDEQLDKIKGYFGKFFVGIAVTVIGAAILVAFGLK